MTRPRWWLVGAGLLTLFLAPPAADAQSTDARLTPGPTAISASVLRARVPSATADGRSTAARPAADRCDPRWDGAVLGAATGVPLGHFGIDLVLVRRGDSCTADCHTLHYILLGAALGAGTGWLLDAWHCVRS